MQTSSATPVIDRFEVRGYIVLQSGEKNIGWYGTLEEANAALTAFLRNDGCLTGYILEHKPNPRGVQ